MHLSLISRVLLALLLAAPASAAAGQERPPDPQLDEVLARAGDSIRSLWKQLPSVTCTELVTQEIFGEKGHSRYKQNSLFDYLMLTKSKGEDLVVEESRILQKDPKKSKRLPLLTTTGFPALALIFHPLYQKSYRFSLDGTELLDMQQAVRVRFEHIPESRSNAALALAGRVYPLDLRGKAWINPVSGTVLKVEAELAAPMESLNLRGLHSVVTYKRQQFSGADSGLWLPATAVIDLETARQRWQNVHKFSDYRQFTVQLGRDDK
jgi:hypothetical protein